MEGIQTSTEKLSYKGKVYNGKLILTNDSEVTTCIDDGKYYAYKEKNSDEVISGIGTCLYDGTTGDFTIESDVDVIQKECEKEKTELQDKINNLTNNVNELKTEVNEKEYEISNLKSTIDNLNNELTVLTGEKEELLKQIENSNLSNNELQNKINELEGTIATLESSLEAKNNEITVLNGEKQELQKTLDNKIKELEELNENLGKITATASDVLSGKTILTSNGLITGTMSNYSNQNIWINNDNGTFYDNITYTYSDGKTTNEMVVFKSNKTGYFDKNTRWLFGKKSSIASIIKSGTSFLGVEGTYTSDATATASQILSGKTAYVNGSKVTGSMTNKSGTTVSATTIKENGDNAEITIPSSGYYDETSIISVPISELNSSLGDKDYEIKSLWSVNNVWNKSMTLNVKSGGPITVLFAITMDGNANYSGNWFTVTKNGINIPITSVNFTWDSNDGVGTILGMSIINANAGDTLYLKIATSQGFNVKNYCAIAVPTDFSFSTT